MADNTIKFNLRIAALGQEIPVRISESLKELQGNLKDIKSSSEKVRESLISWNQISQTIRNLHSGMSDFLNVVHNMTEAYGVQEEAELKLETVMRQRMGATDEMVDSIKKLASEQQAQGVIGDEVQLAGAQQVATFLNEKSSIEKLLPAMNNLAVQRKGLNVTSEDMVNIGNLVGKVMQGNVGALTRVGITFTEAQQKALKYGDESQRAAMLAQVITDNVGSMNAELAKTDAGKAKQMANDFGDLQEEIGKAFAKWEPFMQGFAQIGIVAASVTTVVSSLISMTKALLATTVVQKALNAVWGFGTRNINILRLAVVEYNVAQAMESKGALAAAASTTLFKTALKSLLVATGIGIALAALSTAFDLISASSDKSTKSIEDFNQSSDDTADVASEARAQIASQVGAYQQAIASVTKFKGTKDEEKKVVEKLNATYGDTFGTYETAADWYATLTKYSKAYTDQLYNQAKMQILVNKAAENDLKLADLEKQHPELKGSDATINGKHVKLANTSGYKVDTSDNPTQNPYAKPKLTFDAVTSADGTKRLRNYVEEHTRLSQNSTNLHDEIDSLRKDMAKNNLPAPHRPVAQHHGGSTVTDRHGNGGNTDTKVFRQDAQTTAEISDNISILQEKLSHTKPDTDAYRKISDEIAA